jgi:hypothetical protein
MDKISIIAKNLLHFRVSKARFFSYKRASLYATHYSHFIILILISVFFSGCGYVTGSDMLRHINSITIPPITNDSSEYGLEEDLGTNIKQEFARRGKGWTEGADSLFTAKIIDYKYTAVLPLGQNNQPEQYRLIISMSFLFQDLKRNKIIRDEKNYQKIHDFYIVEGRGKTPETLKEAKQKLITETAEDIVSSIVEEW